MEKLKTYYDSLVSELRDTAENGDHSYHSGSFDSYTGTCDPPYTGDGLSAQHTINEWDEYLKDFGAMGLVEDSDFNSFPEVAQNCMEYWAFEIHGLKRLDWRGKHPLVMEAFCRMFSMNFYFVLTGKELVICESEEQNVKLSDLLMPREKEEEEEKK
jgi:hypothetical protein